MNIICAYAVNIDAVYDVNGEKISEFARSARAPAMKSELKWSIESREDLISSLLFCMQHGSGAELLIEDQALARLIESSFPWQFRLGGNAGIMANVLATLGARPVLNAPALGPRLAGMLHPEVRVPISGELEEPARAAEESEAAPEMVHFVFQFKEGDAVATAEGRIAAPRDNRFIATHDPINTRLISSKHFDLYCQENIQSFDGALLSGFHLASLESYQEIFSQKIAQIKSWKEKNPGIFIHAEMGSFQNQEIMQYLLPRLPVDSLGLNEDELAMAEWPFSGWREGMQAAKRLRNSLALPRVAVHTRDYILSLMMKGLMNPEDELQALTRGTDAAAALAATGSMTSQPPEVVNPIGLEAREEFCREAAATPFGRGAYADGGDVIIFLMPSLLVRKPRFTVGLGDTATAAAFLEEIRALRKASKLPGNME